MYYGLTPQEKERVEMGAFFAITIDPVGYGDLAMVVIWTFVLMVGMAATTYMWIHRHYAPLKAKNIPLMTGIYMHSVFFFLGDLTLCGLVHVRGPFFANCTLMLVWFRSMFGNFALGSLLAIRSYKLYRVFCKNKPMHGNRRYIPYLLFLALIIIVGTVSTAVPRSMSVEYIEGIEFCIVNQHLVTAYTTILWLVWTVYMAMVWLLRNIRSSFNEFREMATSLFLIVVCTVFNQTLLYTVPRLPTSLRWRLALVSVDQITANYIWWLIMFKPLSNCLFRHNEYLTEWRDKMTFDGLRAQYGVGVTDTEMSSQSNTLVYDQASPKSVDPDPSYTESTRIAIDQLASYPMLNQHRLSTTLEPKWNASDRTKFQAELNALRHSNSHARGFERRRSEPYTGASADDAVYAAHAHEQRSRQRMLEQRVFSHCDSVQPLYADSCSHSILEVDRQPVHAEIPNTYLGRGSLDHHMPRSVHFSEIQRWQRSDTDLSLSSSGYSGGRRLL
ncbi:hypothetical protein GGH14_004926 [Coemansia sp. RSA 370]|nr:hypothetical protein GGH14_004926 [Coemansia sp. RSA 370]